MHAAVGCSIGLADEARLADRPELRDKRRHLIRFAAAMRDQIEHRIFRLPPVARQSLGIRYQKAARPPMAGWL
jgi:hypothetical protein